MPAPRTILTDIEGTTSSISFVKEVLFPYARSALAEFVRVHGREPEVRRWLDSVAAEITTGTCDDGMVVKALQGWIDQDRKHTALKALQGMIWEAGYRNGEYRAHVYPDAAQALHGWHASGSALYVYSSGSVAAQQLFFSHSDAGDLSGVFSGYFDTETGPKRESASYASIATAIGAPPDAIVFLSDVVEELDAARAAGLGTVLIDREQDYPVPRIGAACNGHARAEDFSAVNGIIQRL